MTPEKVRHEKKFEISIAQWQLIKERISTFCEFDPHSGPDGVYTVASIYYDTPHLRFYWDREESVGYRRKVRLRAYVVEQKTTALFFEIKERHRNLVAKKRTNLPLKALQAGCNIGGTTPGEDHLLLPINKLLSFTQQDNHVAREIAYLAHRMQLVPVALIRYHRCTYISSRDPGLRITFDYELTCGGNLLHAPDPLSERRFVAATHGILEVKSHVSMPRWLMDSLSEVDIALGKFSKYCSAVDTLYGRPPNALLLPSGVAVAESQMDLAMGE